MATITKYSVDADLVKIRPNILDLGVTEWAEKHEKAFAIINRALIAKWYRTTAYNMGIEDWRATPFDPNLVDADQINLLSCYKTLELIYLHLMKDAPEPDGFERQMELFGKLYNAELKEVLGLGLNYDWNKDDTIDPAGETYVSSQRRLVRC